MKNVYHPSLKTHQFIHLNPTQPTFIKQFCGNMRPCSKCPDNLWGQGWNVELVIHSDRLCERHRAEQSQHIVPRYTTVRYRVHAGTTPSAYQ